MRHQYTSSFQLSKRLHLVKSESNEALVQHEDQEIVQLNEEFSEDPLRNISIPEGNHNGPETECLPGGEIVDVDKPAPVIQNNNTVQIVEYATKSPNLIRSESAREVPTIQTDEKNEESKTSTGRILLVVFGFLVLGFTAVLGAAFLDGVSIILGLALILAALVGLFFLARLWYKPEARDKPWYVPTNVFYVIIASILVALAILFVAG